MNKRVLRSFLVLLCFVFVFSCRPGKDNANIEKRYKTFPCPPILKTDAAWIVLEWNGKPRYGGYGSGFLVDKESGAFFTNKHVSDMFNMLGQGSHKIFFNCEVHDVAIVKVPPLRDAAVIKITDSFNSSNFFGPAPIATEKVKVGDKVTVEGFHPHPYVLRELNRAEGGYNELLVPIYQKYYRTKIYYGGRMTSNLDDEMEIVFEKITGTIFKIGTHVNFGDDFPGIVDRARNMANTYIMVKTDKDHKFPFSGLSGEAVKNIKGETVGILTLGPKEDFEIDKEETKRNADGKTYLKKVFKTFGFTPIRSVENLKLYLNKH
ncbi:MAG: trypsin-like peptidase domain-containing protein [Candidatus Yanofskybacteria bacterium]|nr:trypsin-like peptidase domain-containing protein [Candidatus Yanofskybacteria bacterium]